MGNDPNNPNFNVGLQHTTGFVPGVSPPVATHPGYYNRPTVPHGAGARGSDNLGSTTDSNLMSPTQVRSMQQFLNNHGFQVAQDGVLGPQTKAAAAAFRTNHKAGAQWSAKFGVGIHKGAVGAASSGAPMAVTGAGGGSNTPASAGAGVGTTTPDAFSELLTSLLGQSGQVGSTLDPKGFGAAAAAPDLAAIGVDGQQIAKNPLQETQNQADISNWYGLDPNASSYKLSVLGRLAQAKAGDAAAATGASGNVADLAKSLAGSIGGSANDGSGMVAAAGANDAGTLAALGQANTDYENNMAPLLAAEATGAKTTEKTGNQAALLQLMQQQAADKGKAVADRAAGVASAVGTNNGVEQQRFADQGNLLSTLAQLKAVDPNANPLKDARLQAMINETNARTQAIQSGRGVNGTGASSKLTKANLGSLTAQVNGIANIGADHRIPAGMSVGGVVHLVGSALQAAGISKTDPRYQRLAQTIMGSYLDSNGQPLNIPGTWFGPNTK